MAGRWRLMGWPAVGVWSLCTPIAAAAQVPPPPLLPGQTAIAENIVRAIEGKDAAAYAALLADDLEVYEDGKAVARNKQEWMNAFGAKLSAEGVSFRVSPGFAGTGRLLFIEYFNSTASWGGDVPRHCCWGWDAVAYTIKGGKITVIQRLEGGPTKLGSNSPTQSGDGAEP